MTIRIPKWVIGVIAALVLLSVFWLVVQTAGHG